MSAGVVRWWPALLAATLVAGLVTFMGTAQYAAGDGIFIDWTAYALGSERVLRGEPLYIAEQLAGPYDLPGVTPAGYIYPPPSAVLFAPFAVGSGIGVAAWVGANVALFVSGLAAAVRREMGTLRPVPLAVALLGLLFVLPLPEFVVAPFPNGVVNANANVGLAGILAWAWATGDRRRWLGPVAGIGAVVKIFPGALSLWAARREGWRPVVTAALVAAALVAVTLPITGIEAWRDFLVALANAEPACNARTSVACLTVPFIGTWAAKALGVVVGGLLLLAALRARREYPAFVLLTAGMLAPLADGHHHYLLFFYVLLVVGVARWATRRAARSNATAPASAS